MEAPHLSDINANPAPFSLPPGCRFHPSEEELLRYYLAMKNAGAEENNNDYGNGLIKELDMYEYEPYYLPERARFSFGDRGTKRHWLFYSRARAGNVYNLREAKNGYWRIEGVKDVVVKNRNNGDNNKRGNLVVGTRTNLVFFSGNSLETAVMTDWIMHEYAPVDHVQDSFVLCRVFVKSSGSKSDFSVERPIFVYAQTFAPTFAPTNITIAAEERVSTLHHIVVQRDGILVPDFSEGKVAAERFVSLQEDHVISGPVSDAFQFPAGASQNEQATTSGHTGTGLIGDAVTTEELQALLEEDFVELDDLVPQISGFQ